VRQTILLQGGRVVDPGTNFDGNADLLIEDGRIAALRPAAPAPAADRAEPACSDEAGTYQADTIVDARGLIIGPGFVDLHSHVHSIAGQRLQACDGVTTALDLEAGLMPITRAFADASDAGRPLNYGFAASWGGARQQVLTGQAPDASLAGALAVLGNPDWQRDSTPGELDAWLDLLRTELGAGALGIGVLQGYAPRTNPVEFLAVARLAAEAGVPVFTHVRELVEVDPSTPIDGSTELVRAAAETGAHMHHCHVNSTSRRHVDRVLQLFDRARREGSPVTVEAYPYGAGSTAIGAAFLEPDVLATWGLTPRSVVLLGSGERVSDAARLVELRRGDPGAPCIIEFLDERDPADVALLLRALQHPDSMVASDAMPVYWDDGAHDTRDWPLPPGGRTHPRTAGTFSRAIRLMVRERGAWSWTEAFRRCAYLPARVLDTAAPAARRKGHLGIGADADVVVLDPGSVADRATYTDPTRPSAGVQHLLVGGEFVIRDGQLLAAAYPGQAVRTG
jgi:N-acyl-D-aspartate/D-glutamate deacylase